MAIPISEAVTLSEVELDIIANHVADILGRRLATRLSISYTPPPAITGVTLTMHGPLTPAAELPCEEEETLSDSG